MNKADKSVKLGTIPNLIFASRWLQLPLYVGLIVAQGVYTFHFWVELVHLVEAAFGNQDALKAIFAASGQRSAEAPTHLTETTIMLVVLGLIDVVMISNLLIMVIVGATKPLCRACTWKVTQTNLNGWTT